MPPFELMNSALRKLAAVLGLFFLATTLVHAAAGRVQFVAGEVKIQNSKHAERVPKKGDEIDSGDTILTAGNGSMQLALADGGLLAVRPNTQLRIDDYVYTGNGKDKNNKSFFSLFKGTFRSITGAIGQNNKDAYKVTTPTATMGIRGTDHEPAVVLPLPPGVQVQSNLQSAPPGTYDRVNSGQTFIQNANGLVLIGANQVGFAPSGGGAPTILPKVPSFYSSAPKPGPAKKLASSGGGAQSGGSSASGGTGTTSGGSSGTSDSTSTSSTSTSSSADSGTTTSSGSTTSTSTTDTSTLSALSTTQTSTLTSSSTTSGTVSTNTTITTTTAISSTITSPTSSSLPSIPTIGVAGANVSIYIDPVTMMPAPSPGNGAINLIDSANQTITLGTQNEVQYILNNGSAQFFPSYFEFSSAGTTATSALTNQGSAMLSDGSVVQWGRWTPGYTIMERDPVTGSIVPTSTVGDFHYIFSNNLTPLNLVLTPGALTGGMFAYAGGTQPTDLNGAPATIIPAMTTLSVDFTQQTVAFNVAVTLGSGQTLSGSATGTVGDFVSNVGINNGAAGGVQSPTLLKANGQFVGATASGAITSYGISDAVNPGVGAVGTVLFGR